MEGAEWLRLQSPPLPLPRQQRTVVEDPGWLPVVDVSLIRRRCAEVTGTVRRRLLRRHVERVGAGGGAHLQARGDQRGADSGDTGTPRLTCKHEQGGASLPPPCPFPPAPSSPARVPALLPRRRRSSTRSTWPRAPGRQMRPAAGRARGGRRATRRGWKRP